MVEEVHIGKPTTIVKPPPSAPKVQQISANMPSFRNDYDISDTFNLWDISPKQKESLFKRYQAVPDDQKPKKTDNSMEINYGKDVQFQGEKKKF